MKSTAKVVHYNSPEAAQHTTVSGWLSRTGSFWPDSYPAAEQVARNSGATHKDCPTCGELMETASYCGPCHDRKSTEKYMALPAKAYADLSPSDYLMIWQPDEDSYVRDYQGLIDYCNTHDVSPRKLQLAIAKPNYVLSIEPSEYLSDSMADEADVPDELEEAFGELNRAIAAFNEKQPISWGPKATYRVVMTEEQIAEAERDAGLSE